MSELHTLPEHECALRFGPYCVHPRQRLVLEAGRPLRLGRRALDILLILLEQPGTVVSKQTLIARVWPTSVVEDGNLRVHMAALRKALGDGQAGQRYILTVAQRGYSFVAPLSFDAIAHAPHGAPHGRGHNLPLRRTRLIGRQPLIDCLMQRLPQQRFITLTGAGGIGKTSVALRVAELLIGHYRDGICLLDLAPLNAPAMILPNLATLLGLALQDAAPLDGIARSLQERQMLLVIDNCEHLLDDIALISETLLRSAPRLHILTTSREALRAEGEYVQRLEPLACPPATGDRAQAMTYPALQLLIERTRSRQETFELNDTELPLAIDICQRLEGIPLAIELVAAQIEPFSLPGLLLEMEDTFRLLARGRRGAQPRHQTLRATLDWSHERLTRGEQIALRRLAVFRGSFNLASASAVVVDTHLPVGEVLSAVTQLAAKSLLNVEVGDEEVVYRLLDITRTYALEKLAAAGEVQASRERHAACCLARMEQAQDAWERLPTSQWIERYAPLREDIRAALDWSLGDQGVALLGIRLTVSAMPLWQELSLVTDHGLYARKALVLLEQSPSPCPRLGTRLHLALGSFSYHSRGATSQTLAAFANALTLAESVADLPDQLRAVSGHMAANLCDGDYRQALEKSQHFDRIGLHSDPAWALSAQRLRVLALHYTGSQTLAAHHAEQVIQRMAQNGQLNRFTPGFGVQYDQSVASLTVQARIQWLQGFPDRAWRTANQALELAVQIKHGTSICYTLALAGVVIAHYNGDTTSARALLERLQQQAQQHSVLLFQTWASHYARALGDAVEVSDLQALGLVQDILVTWGSATVDEPAVERARQGHAGWCAAEILRVRAEALLLLGEPSQAQAVEALLLEALDLARRQGALAWELRSAISLARLWISQGRRRPARKLLASVHGRFTEGFTTRDLVCVRELLDGLQDHLLG